MSTPFLSLAGTQSHALACGHLQVPRTVEEGGLHSLSSVVTHDDIAQM